LLARIFFLKRINHLYYYEITRDNELRPAAFLITLILLGPCSNSAPLSSLDVCTHPPTRSLASSKIIWNIHYMYCYVFWNVTWKYFSVCIQPVTPLPVSRKVIWNKSLCLVISPETIVVCIIKPPTWSLTSEKRHCFVNPTVPTSYTYYH